MHIPVHNFIFNKKRNEIFMRANLLLFFLQRIHIKQTWEYTFVAFFFFFDRINNKLNLYHVISYQFMAQNKIKSWQFIFCIFFIKRFRQQRICRHLFFYGPRWKFIGFLASRMSSRNAQLVFGGSAKKTRIQKLLLQNWTEENVCVSEIVDVRPPRQLHLITLANNVEFGWCLYYDCLAHRNGYVPNAVLTQNKFYYS